MHESGQSATGPKVGHRSVGSASLLLADTVEKVGVAVGVKF
jgi:hypothetical protein